MKMEIFMKIYLTDLKAYNSGHLVGEWINLPIEEIELKDYPSYTEALYA